ncbi:SapC family protein [Aestuariibacter sp. A3R04]|uniref:SapC family protein n=1 Tax=Aestuariibacter sp. A3R04 TaxID=2841571 RepID=UPI001C08AC46|nr:SapC family protein [Aestuariibacter sp. A3R04]MBU3021268.1 SapC family protein [Aestuariibacter sp. A3R04]
MAEQQFELVNPKAHQGLKINHTQFDIPENHVNAVTVVANELSVIVHNYPVFIAVHPESGDYQLMALLGFDKGENLYLHEGNWRCNVIPIDVLRKPFQAYIPDPSKPDKGHIALDVNHPLVSTEVGEPIYDKNGDATSYFQRIEGFFNQLVSDSRATSALLKKAADMALLEQFSLELTLPNKQTVALKGLYGFDKKKVDALSKDDLETCHRSGLLQICHLVLSSSSHLQTLMTWKAQTQSI